MAFADQYPSEKSLNELVERWPLRFSLAGFPEGKGEQIDDVIVGLTLLEWAYASKAEKAGDWLEAIQRFNLILDETKQARNAETLGQLIHYVARAEAADGNNAEVKTHQAFNEYFLAKAGDPTDAASYYAHLRQAADRLGSVIEKRDPDRWSRSLYDAHWRYANLLVELAFLGSPEQQEPDRRNALENARLALNIVDSNGDRRTPRSPAYFALGNAAEDLAHYSKNLTDEAREEYFLESASAFEKAAALTEMVSSLKARYSLSRCLYRRYSASGDPQHLEEALRKLGRLDPSAPKTDIAEWHLRGAEIFDSRGDERRAFTELDSAKDVLEKAELEQTRLYAVVIQKLADVLLTSPNNHIANCQRAPDIT